MSRKQKVFITIVVLLLSYLTILYPKAAGEGVKNGLDFCSSILIPSLFPFMIISSFVVKSGVYVIIGKVGGWSTKFLFNLPNVTFATIILSLIGGYPTGAKGINSLVDRKAISEKQAEFMLLFCVGAGPGFIINAVGCGLLKSFDLGVILFFSQVLASLFLGIVCSLFYKKSFIAESKTENKDIIKCKDTNDTNISKALIMSVSDSINAIMSMCGFVLLFSYVISVLQESGFLNFIADILEVLSIPESISNSILPALLEVTTGCKIAISLNVPIELIALILGFAGFCVHCQIFSMINFEFSKLKFLLARLVHGSISAISTYVLLKIFPVATPTYLSTVSFGKLDFSFNMVGVLSLLFMSVVFLLSIKEVKN